MKKFIITAMAIVMMMSLASCGKEEPESYTATVGETYEALFGADENESESHDSDGIDKYEENTLNWYIRAYETGLISIEQLEEYLFG